MNVVLVLAARERSKAITVVCVVLQCSVQLSPQSSLPALFLFLACCSRFAVCESGQPYFLHSKRLKWLQQQPAIAIAIAAASAASKQIAVAVAAAD